MTDKMLIKAEQIQPVDVFVDGKYLEILDFIKTESAIEKPDVSTGKGRSLIRSTAAKIASSRVFIEKARKELSDKERAKIDKTLSAILESGNFIKDALTYHQADVRKPLTDYETKIKALEAAEIAEQERLKQKAVEDEKAVIEAEKNLIEEEKKKLEAERMQIEADKKATAKAEETQKETQKETQLSILRKQAEAEQEAERVKQVAAADAKQA